MLHRSVSPLSHPITCLVIFYIYVVVTICIIIYLFRFEYHIKLLLNWKTENTHQYMSLGVLVVRIDQYFDEISQKKMRSRPGGSDDTWILRCALTRRVSLEWTLF